MPGVRDKELISLKWPGGVNNVQKETAVPAIGNEDQLGQLRGASNVNLNDAGEVESRAGYTQRFAGPSHSLFATMSYLFGVTSGVLRAISANLSATNVTTGVGESDLSYTMVGGYLYWTNGVVLRKVDDDLNDLPVGVECPGQPSVAAYASAGGLFAGQYQVAITYLSSTGEESGSSLATLVDVEEGQGIQLTGIPVHATASWVRIYVSNANGDVLYHATDIPNGSTTYIIGVGQRTRALETQFMYPMPAGQIVRYIGGRLMVATRNILRWSPPLRPNLTQPDNFRRYGGDITMLEGVGDGPTFGYYIGANHDQNPDKASVYFISGTDPKAQGNMRAYPAGVVPGTAIQIEGTKLGLEYAGKVPYWLSTNGMFCAGLPGGRVIPLTESRFLADTGATRGASLYRELNGIKQLITTASGGEVAAGRASDEAIATVRRHGVTT